METSPPSTAAAATAGSIEISLVHNEQTEAALAPINGLLLGPLQVKVLDPGGTTVAMTTVEVGTLGRIEGLAPGAYRLVLTQESPVTYPSESVGISAATRR